MSEINKAAVVIPFYKDTLTNYESIALQQCFKILHNYTIIAVKPEKLTLPADAAKYPFTKTVSFDDDYFKDIQGYNRLMLDAAFYKEFLDHEYILIYQLDAFVFTDDLTNWCNQGFDYIGAPWIRPVKQGFFKSIKNHIQNYFHVRFNLQKGGLPSPKQVINRVGNGGFSLRRTAIFYELCLKHADRINAYNNLESHYYNEDVFWSIEINRRQKVLKIPYYKKALKFAFEFHPHRALIMNNNELPFGCHAWDLYIDFWRPIFKERGYNV